MVHGVRHHDVTPLGEGLGGVAGGGPTEPPVCLSTESLRIGSGTGVAMPDFDPGSIQVLAFDIFGTTGDV
ncbi:hypothetical protein DMH04_10820 [Kibdelosporangium aridum]|uniref:Uncharacterized protein n=1 Tax=Kibdelosporangium aridum TaxID=2030 RepID=A0A428ZHG9_KIBAR|nr:hypothetical protein DMH04_10820 [Kibdelosporangium aridum]